MVAIIDYGVGNLFSLSSSFGFIGENAVVTASPEVIRQSERILLPGVGAFQDAMEKLKNSGLIPVIVDEVKKGKPLLGICLGMQLLFEKSFEYGVHEGLGLIKGEIRPISDVIPCELKVPHIGWNALSFRGEKNPLFLNLKEGDHVYFVHSFYAANCEKSISAVTEYGAELTAAVRKNNVYGCQFHPEKSGSVGLEILRAFCQLEDSVC